MLGLTELGGRTGGLGARFDEVRRVQLTSTVVTLVATGVVITADRAGAFDVTIRQGTSGGWLEGPHLRLLDEIAVLVKSREDFLGDVGVIERHRRGVEIIRQAQTLQILSDDVVELLGALLGRESHLIGLDRNRGAVAVRAGDHEDTVTRHSHEPREDVRGNTES